MIFNFYLGNHDSSGLRGMADLLVPIYNGLEEAGHNVMGYGLGFRPAPAVNLIVEFFPDDAFVDSLLQLKAASSDRLILGLLCTEDIEDALVMQDPANPRRLANLMRVLKAVDFVWTLLPQVEVLESICGPGKAALLEYGFSPRCLHPRLRNTAQSRTLDAVMYGNTSPYRQPLIDALAARGLSTFVTARDVLPMFVTADVLSRAKLVLDVRRGPGVRFMSPTRIVRALHVGVAVVAEDLGPSPISSLYRYTLACPYEQIVERSEQLVRSGLFADLGLAALEKFRVETSMAGNLASALRLPVFEALSSRAV